MLRLITKQSPLNIRNAALFFLNIANFGKVIPIKLGDLGEGTKEATVKTWFVKEGAKIKEFDDLCEVFTDKLVAKIPCTHSGEVKKLYVKENEMCQVGSPIIDLDIGDVSETHPEKESPKSIQQPKTEEKPKEKVIATGKKIIPIKLGDLGEGTKEATVKTWFIKQGSIVKEFDDLCEVFTDKLVAKIPCTHSGKVMKLYVKENELCQVGSPIIDLEIEGKFASEEKSKEEEVKEKVQSCPLSKQQSISSKQTKNVEAVPAARELAKKLGIDLSKIVGTGPEGRIKKEDVIKFAESMKTLQQEPEKIISPTKEGRKVECVPAVRELAKKMGVDLSLVPGTGQNGRITHDDVKKFVEEQKKPKKSEGKIEKEGKPSPATPPAQKVEALKEDRIVKIVGIYKAMTKSMTDALEIPTYTVQEYLSMDNIMKIRDIYADQMKTDKKMTFLPFYVKAVSQALLDYPILNSLTSPNKDSDGYIVEYVQKADHNISIAIDTPMGLIVPNIKKVQEKSILDINEEIRLIINKTKKGSLTNEDLTGGTFTVSNIGNLGGICGTPVIFRPQIGIMALGVTIQIPNFEKKGDGYKITPINTVIASLVCDHRIIDGATGVRFLMKFKHYISHPSQLLLKLK